MFDNCIFKVLNTVNLITLDYSTDSKYGCTAATEAGAGDLTITNSQFIDSVTSGAVSDISGAKSLFNVKSLYNIVMKNVTFTGMKQSHLG